MPKPSSDVVYLFNRAEKELQLLRDEKNINIKNLEESFPRLKKKISDEKVEDAERYKLIAEVKTTLRNCRISVLNARLNEKLVQLSPQDRVDPVVVEDFKTEIRQDWFSRLNHLCGEKDIPILHVPIKRTIHLSSSESALRYELLQKFNAQVDKERRREGLRGETKVMRSEHKQFMDQAARRAEIGLNTASLEHLQAMNEALMRRSPDEKYLISKEDQRALNVSQLKVSVKEDLDRFCEHLVIASRLYSDILFAKKDEKPDAAHIASLEEKARGRLADVLLALSKLPGNIVMDLDRYINCPGDLISLTTACPVFQEARDHSIRCYAKSWLGGGSGSSLFSSSQQSPGSSVSVAVVLK